MGAPGKNLSDRELRSLDLADFLNLLQEDIRELDALRRQRRRPDGAEKPARKGRAAAVAEPEPDDEPIEPLALHAVVCCDKRLGSFPSPARIRCPFCEQWLRAGDFPLEPA